MTITLFDTRLRAQRRDRAFRNGPRLFLHERAFADICERIAMVRRRFSSALLLGCPDPAWINRLAKLVDAIEVADPGPLFAAAAGGACVVEEQWACEPGRFDLIVAVGCLDTVNDVPGVLLRLRFALADDGLLIGAVAGGDTLPLLRSAMRAADATAGHAAPHVHPRLEPGALAGLLSAAGFAMPVVDVDRVAVRYRSLASLVADLRGMAATNILTARPCSPLPRKAVAAAAERVAASGIERFELLHFAAWTPG